MICESSVLGVRMIGIYSNLMSLLCREVCYIDNGQNEFNMIYVFFFFMFCLVCNGDWINGFYKNGSKWIKFYQVEFFMGDCVEMGLVVFFINFFGMVIVIFDKVNFMFGMNLFVLNIGLIVDVLFDVQWVCVFFNLIFGVFIFDFEQFFELEVIVIFFNEFGQFLW